MRTCPRAAKQISVRCLPDVYEIYKSQISIRYLADVYDEWQTIDVLQMSARYLTLSLQVSPVCLEVQQVACDGIVNNPEGGYVASLDMCSGEAAFLVLCKITSIGNYFSTSVTTRHIWQVSARGSTDTCQLSVNPLDHDVF